MSDPAAAPAKLPSQIWYLAWNEAAERFSYYGMTSILALHLVRNLAFAEHEAISAFQLFTAAVYLTPLAGALLADAFLGRYRTVLYLSFGYVAGHAVLAAWESPRGVLVGLALIAAAAGGIKPCASAFAADQVPAGDDRAVERVYNLYYFMINLGAVLSTLAIPWLFDHRGPRFAFAVPGLAMAIALAVFWAGRRRYVMRRPAVARGAPPPRGAGRSPGREAQGADAAAPDSPWRAVGRIALVFAPVVAFWALYFQYGSAWTLQADKLDRVVLGYEISTGQVQTLNSVLILVLVPLFSLGVYPAVARLGIRVTPLRKMSAGMFVTVLSFVAAAAVEARLQAGLRPHVAAQVPQYVFQGVGEVLVSVTALEFAYTQAPRALKSLVMGLWSLTISAGSLLAASVAWLNRFQGAAYYEFFAALMLAAACAFLVVAWRYRPAEPEAGAEAAGAT